MFILHVKNWRSGLEYPDTYIILNPCHLKNDLKVDYIHALRCIPCPIMFIITAFPHMPNVLIHTHSLSFRYLHRYPQGFNFLSYLSHLYIVITKAGGVETFPITNTFH